MQLKWPMRWDLFSLFPAYAGVIPIRRAMTFLNNHFSPHTRG